MGLLGGLGTVGVDSKKDLIFREGLPRATNHATALAKYARRSRTCARGVKYAMSEGKKTLEVTICILVSVSIEHLLIASDAHRKKSPVKALFLHPPIAYITEEIQMHSSILRSTSPGLERSIVQS